MGWSARLPSKGLPGRTYRALAGVLLEWGGRPVPGTCFAWEFAEVGAFDLDPLQSDRRSLERSLHVLRTAWRTHHARKWLAKDTRTDSRLARDKGVVMSPGVVDVLHRIA
eukprot:5402979-Alexandrium_andersonii.AAC.1